MPTTEASMSTTTEVEPRPLTARQAEIYRWIFEQTKANGYQPSMRETAIHFGFTSPNAVFGFFKAMRKKGWMGQIGCDARCVRFRFCPNGLPFRGFEEK